MALTKLQSNGIAVGAVTTTALGANVVTDAKILDATISNDKLANPFSTGKAIAMSIVFG